MKGEEEFEGENMGLVIGVEVWMEGVFIFVGEEFWLGFDDFLKRISIILVVGL